MRISIWDMDWFYKTSFKPNFKAQKIASYYKQKGDFVHFINENSQFAFDYDIIYIIREIKATPFVPHKYIDKHNVKLIGKDFKYYDNYWEMPIEIDRVKPDYELYDLDSKNNYANAVIVQMLHKGAFISDLEENTIKKNKLKQKSIIVDEGIWELEPIHLQQYLNRLLSFKNIIFLHPIGIKALLFLENRKLFFQLDFYAKEKLKWKNDAGSDLDSVISIIDLMDDFKKNCPNIYIGSFPVKSIIYNHWSNIDYVMEDIARLLKITDYAKEKMVHLIIKTPNDRHSTPFWFFFDMMEMWTKTSFSSSYIEMMTYSLTMRTGLQWQEIINNPLKWSVPRVEILLYIITHKPELIPFMLRKWGQNSIDKTYLNPIEISKFKDCFERDEVVKNLILQTRGGIE